MPLFTVLMYGGIGDTLRNLSIFPHEAIHRRTGIRTVALYKHWRLTGEHQYTNPPDTDLFQGLADRIPSLRWGGETIGHKGPGALANRLVREVVKLGHGGAPPLYPLHPQLTPEEKAALPDLKGRRVIGVQPHVTGTYTKKWGVENWRRFLALLAQSYPDAAIVILETSREGRDLALSERFLTTDHLNLFQLIELIRGFGLMISIDSWPKYVAGWNEIPQVVIVPDQTPQYPILTPDHLFGLQFASLAAHPRNRFVGLERHASGRGVYTLAKMSDLAPETLHRQVTAHEAAFPLVPSAY
jgi:hypothetical protein